MIFPIFLPMGSGGGNGGSPKALLAFAIAFLFGLFIILAGFHFMGITLNIIFENWWGPLLGFSILFLFMGFVVSIAMWFDK